MDALFIGANKILGQNGRCAGVHCPHCPLYKLNQPKREMKNETYCKAGGIGNYDNIINELNKWLEIQDQKTIKINKIMIVFGIVILTVVLIESIWFVTLGVIK